MKPVKFVTLAILGALMLVGCNKHSGTTANSNKVRVGYIGLTCEAPIYAAYEKGFFKEEGLEPELVKCNWANYKDTLALGRYDITHHLIMYFLKPIGSLLIAEGKVRKIADQIMDEPYNREYCCEIIANGKWVDANPKTAAAATRALLKGTKWVETNPKAAAVLAVEKKYLASTPELNTVALARLRYIPSIKMAEESLYTASREMKVAKMLSPETDTDALAKRAFMHLEGITDDWIKSLRVETVAGGQVAPNEDIRLLAALIQKDTEDSCCRRKMFDQPDQEAPNLADPDAPCPTKTMIANE